MRTFKAISDVKEEIRTLQADVDKIKMALVILPEADGEEIFHMDLHENTGSFEDFCSHLGDGNYRKIVVSKFSSPKLVPFILCSVI